MMNRNLLKQSIAYLLAASSPALAAHQNVSLSSLLYDAFYPQEVMCHWLNSTEAGCKAEWANTAPGCNMTGDRMLLIAGYIRHYIARKDDGAVCVNTQNQNTANELRICLGLFAPCLYKVEISEGNIYGVFYKHQIEEIKILLDAPEDPTQFLVQ